MKKVYAFAFILVILVLSLSASWFLKRQNFKVSDENQNLDFNYSSLERYFEGINGCTVILDKQNNKYYFYNKDMARAEVSPYSTFKIMSTLMGLKNGIIKNKQSKMKYSGTKYPLDVWNSDLSLEQAFKSSCVWYFRQVIDKIGKDTVYKELKDISYGNCNISEWNGNDTNPMTDLNGFWINSSLLISPVEQVNVLSKIFEGRSIYGENNIRVLKDIMLIHDDEISKIYGKTGSGRGKAWFIGFKEQNENRYYFAVYLDDQNRQEVINGQKAKEIALKIIK